MKRLLLLCMVAFLATYVAPSKLFAQGAAETGTITGLVTDPTGAAVPKANVTIVNPGTSAKRETTTDDHGNYVVTNLLPAVYSVTVNASGFAKREQRVELTVGAKVSLDFQLTIGATVTSVEVVAQGGVQVNVETQTLSTVISSKEVSEGPTIDLNPYHFVVTSGNIADNDVSPSGSCPTCVGSGAGVVINGLRSASTNILLDGGANNDEFTGTIGQQIPLESVQEFSVLTSNFTAEYGRATGGVVNVVTKSGTNTFHGSAYETNRVAAYGANDFFNNASGTAKPGYTRNQFGFSAGGPIKKDKLFFFANPEWTRVRSALPVQAMIPDASLIAATDPATTQAFFSALGGNRSNLVTLQTFSRSQLIALGADPCPVPTTGTAGATCRAAFPATSTVPLFDKVSYNVPSDAGGGAPQNTYDVVGRVDYVMSDRTQFYSRYARFHEEDFAGFVNNSAYNGPTGNAGYDTGETIVRDNALLSLVHTFGGHWTEQTKFVYNRTSLVQGLGKNPVVPTLYWNKTFGPDLLGIPLQLPGYSATTPGNAIPFGGPQNFYQSYEDVSYARGKHTFRFGGSYVFFQDNRTFGAYEEAVESLGTSGVNGAAMDRLLSTPGALRTFTVAINPQGKLPCVSTAAPTPNCTLTLPASQPNFSRSNRYNEFAFYGQDSWKVSPRVTLNLGLRWEYFGVQHNKNPLLDSNYYDGAGGSVFNRIRNGDVSVAPLSVVGGLWAKDWHNFAPRVGFAWDIFGNGRTSLRGGYSIAYERNFGNVTFNVIQNPPNYGVVDLTGGVDPGCCSITTSNLSGFGGTGTKALPRLSLRNVDSNIRNAYAHLYTGSLEREVAHNVIVAVEYSGSKGQKLYTLDPVNRLGSGNVFLGDPCTPGACTSRLRPTQYSTINRRENQGFSSYNALNLRLNITNVANTGLTLTSNYTWSHAFDNLSTTFSTSVSGNTLDLGPLDPFNPHLDRGPADFDIRHRIVISGTWDVPFARNTHGVMKHALDGWIVAPIFVAHTGAPFSEYDSTNIQFQQLPRLILTGAVPRTGSGSPPSFPGVADTFTYLDFSSAPVAEFTNPITGNSEFGPYPSNMTGRNFFRGPGYWNLDFGIHKKFSITERYGLEIKADMFDIFNHANLFVIGSSADFGTQPVVTACRGTCLGTTPSPVPQQHRNIQLQAKFTF